jgi:Tol biopolymer transport system component
MNADGSGRRHLTHNRTRDENPDWSPDGIRLAYYSERVGNAEIYVVGADGRGVRRLTRDPWYSSIPRWRPSG